MAPCNSVTRWRPAALIVAGAVLIGGCLGGSDEQEPTTAAEPRVVQPGAPGEPTREVSAEELEQLESSEHTQADVDFMRGMIHHHAQALVMTSMVRKRSAGRELPLLARRMEISQENEMEVMERWLTDRGEEPPTEEEHKHEHGVDGTLMPGMISAGKLAALAEAEGAKFNELFLRHMINHHQGALTMVRQLHEENGGAEPEIGNFTRHVEGDQGIEIARMQDMLAAQDRRPPRADAPRREQPSRAESARATRLAFAGGKPRICIIA